jgi:hypothetical protein
MSANRSVPNIRVTAEWALWGMTHVLSHSQGAIDSQIFDDVLKNFPPGSLLDQRVAVTIVPYSQPDLITMAIHDRYPLGEHERSGDDRAGRGTLAEGRSALVDARLFCIPYSALAPGAVSYLSMYDEFRAIRPSPRDRRPISARLPISDPAGPVAHLNPLAARVAALLLTTDKVCVLGADQLELRERLKFIDTVASLMPYGMRTKLSASTWVSATMDSHDLRLFFARTTRSPRTREVRWGATESTPIGDADADEYLALLNSGTLRQSTLAKYDEPVDFTRENIGQMLGRLMFAQDRARSAYQPSPTDDVSLRELLRSCGQGLDGRADLASDIERLQGYLDRSRTLEQRRSCLELVKQFRLFRTAPLADTQLLGRFYDTLINLAFGANLSYPDYCEIEASCGDGDDQPPSVPLLRAMLRDSPQLPVLLLILATLGDEEFRQALRDEQLDADAVVMIAASADLAPRHTAIVVGIIARNLLDRPGTRDQSLLRAALARHEYLAPTLERQFADEPDTQLDLLTQILRIACGKRIRRSDVADLLGGTPTMALLGAVTRLASPRDLPAVTQQFAISSIGTAKFSTAATEELTDRLTALEHKTSTMSLFRSRA